MLRTYFKVMSYRLIPGKQFEAAVQFLDRHLTKLQTRAAETTEEKWRNKYYSAIYAKCRQTGTTKEQLYQMADQYLDVSITSLTELSGSQLKHLYNIVVE